MSDLRAAIEKAIKDHCEGGDLWLCAHIASEPFDAQFDQFRTELAAAVAEMERLQDVIDAYQEFARHVVRDDPSITPRGAMIRQSDEIGRLRARLAALAELETAIAERDARIAELERNAGNVAWQMRDGYAGVEIVRHHSNFDGRPKVSYRAEVDDLAIDSFSKADIRRHAAEIAAQADVEIARILAENDTLRSAALRVESELARVRSSLQYISTRCVGYASEIASAALNDKPIPAKEAK